jgi:hypothetical protein
MVRNSCCLMTSGWCYRIGRMTGLQPQQHR